MLIPRIITVDPTWTIARIVRTAIDLMDRPIIQVDVPGSAQVLQELKQGCTLIITNFEIDDDMKGFELAMRVKRESPDTAVIVMGDDGDPGEFDPETAAESPYVYLSRPLDVQKFLRVLSAGLEGRNLHEAYSPQALPAPVINDEMGPVPGLDLDGAQDIIDSLLSDLGAMAIILSTRTGEVLLERGAVGYLNREQLTAALLPAVLTGIDVKEIVGGQMSSVQFYDGEEFDVFLLTVGLHHFLCVIFDGEMGAKQFGAVNRFGRRAVLDLIAKIGANAFFVQPKVKSEEEPRIRRKPSKPREEEEEIILAKAELNLTPVEPEPQALHLEPIADLNLDDIFGKTVDDTNMEDLFSLDEIERLASSALQQNMKGKLDQDRAREIGLLSD
ncbi:MAG: hypothetical protein MUF87_21230 [Anaerolineae bacterium]|jgi:DNA-binding NarL/FixJ family response regulator|nr:hypothetical protein [Anaerolineae bacterium]